MLIKELETFVKAVYEISSNLSSNNRKFFMIGNFNIDILKAHSNSIIKDYVDNLTRYSVKCTIDKPIRLTV